MLIPQSYLANVTWTEEDVRHSASVASPGPAAISLTRYGTLPTRAAES